MTGIPEKTDGTLMFPHQGADVVLQSRGQECTKIPIHCLFLDELSAETFFSFWTER
jgi:hypothetical protein